MKRRDDPAWTDEGDCSTIERPSPSEEAEAPPGTQASVPDVCDDAAWAFVIGAPRCGTTSLSRYLYHRPDVCFSSVKEPHFFSVADLSPLSDADLRQKVRDDYLDRYLPQRNVGQLLAEGSVTYLYVPEQLEPILRLWPQAKFVIGVRNPLTMVPSLHQRLCFNGDETERDFSTAWALVPERRQGRSIPRSCAHPRWLDYWEAGRLGKYVGQCFDRLGREQCFVYLFDDFFREPARVYREVQAFLGLPDEGRTAFPRHRATKDYRFGWLQRLLRRPPRSLVAFGGERYARIFAAGPAGASGAMAKALWAARDRVLDWNKVPAAKPTVPPELRAEMKALYGDDVARLGELLGRDLGHWLADEEPTPGPA